MMTEGGGPAAYVRVFLPLPATVILDTDFCSLIPSNMAIIRSDSDTSG